MDSGTSSCPCPSPTRRRFSIVPALNDGLFGLFLPRGSGVFFLGAVVEVVDLLVVVSVGSYMMLNSTIKKSISIFHYILGKIPNVLKMYPNQCALILISILCFNHIQSDETIKGLSIQFKSLIPRDPCHNPIHRVDKVSRVEMTDEVAGACELWYVRLEG